MIEINLTSGVKKYNTAPVSGSVTELTTIPVDLSYASVAAMSLHQDDIYIFGGGNQTDTFLRYNIPLSTWYTIPRAAVWPAGQYGGTLVTIADELFLLGGSTSAGYDGKLMSYNIQSEVWVSRLGLSAGRYSSIAYNDQLIAVAATDGRISKYNPQNNTWTTLRSSSNAKTSTALAIYNDILYMAGGHGSQALSTYYSFNLVNNFLSNTGLNIGARNHAGFEFIGDYGLLFGGNYATDPTTFVAIKHPELEISYMTPSLPTTFNTSIFSNIYQDKIIFQARNKLWLFNPFT